MTKSKFALKDKRSFKEKATDFARSLLFWKGRRKGMIHTRDITWEDIRKVFFPRDFYEKYQYLGSVPYNELGPIFEAMEPLVIFMDYKARPWWCPRWFLRFLHLFGMDNSIVRVRNRFLSKLAEKITGYIMLMDYKTKWKNYDLRISVVGDRQVQNLADAIESRYYEVGYRRDLADQIKELDPNTVFNSGYAPSSLNRELERLVEEADKKDPVVEHEKKGAAHKH
jgi:hypothetical protein